MRKILDQKRIGLKAGPCSTTWQESTSTPASTTTKESDVIGVTSNTTTTKTDETRNKQHSYTQISNKRPRPKHAGKYAFSLAFHPPPPVQDINYTWRKLLEKQEEPSLTT